MEKKIDLPEYLYIKYGDSVLLDKVNNCKFLFVRLKKTNEISKEIAFSNMKLYNFDKSIFYHEYDYKKTILKQIQFVVVKLFMFNKKVNYKYVTDIKEDDNNSGVYKIVNIDYVNSEYESILNKKRHNKNKRDLIINKCTMIKKFNKNEIFLDKYWVINEINKILKKNNFNELNKKFKIYIDN